MSTLTLRLIEAQSNKLNREARLLRRRADELSSERIAQFLRRRAWFLTAKARELMEMLGDL